MRHGGSRLSRHLVGAIAICLSWSSACGPDDPEDEPAVGTTSLPRTVQEYRSPRDYATMPRPVSVHIPVIGVRSDLEELHRQPDGTVQVPSAWDRAGWYAEGPRPGQAGPAVLLGHVDSKRGPAVFYRLQELRRGDEIVVERQDGSKVHFVVTWVERHPKDRFPTEAVYFPSLEPGLRLVTCGGAFDRGTSHYRDNVIVYAEPGSGRPSRG